MRNIAFLTILYLSVIYNVKSQPSSPSVYPHAFIVDNPIENNKIQVAGGGGAYIYGSLSINIQNILASFQFATINFAIISGQNVLFSADGPTFAKESDFYNDSYISEAKDFSINVPASVMYEVLNWNPNAKLVVRYKFRSGGYSQWFPLNEENIGEYYIGDDKYGFVQSYPPTTVLGPDQICDEGIYTINNPYGISLKNADGIASLTVLSIGQYKIEREDGANGVIELVSTVGSTEYSKRIVVGSPPPSISGRDLIYGNSENYYTVEKSDPNSTLTLQLPGSPKLPYDAEEISEGTIRILTDAVNSGVNDYLIIIRAKETNSCGISTTTEKHITLRGGGPAS